MKNDEKSINEKKRIIQYSVHILVQYMATTMTTRTLMKRFVVVVVVFIIDRHIKQNLKNIILDLRPVISSLYLRLISSTHSTQSISQYKWI